MDGRASTDYFGVYVTSLCLYLSLPYLVDIDKGTSSSAIVLSSAMSSSSATSKNVSFGSIVASVKIIERGVLTLLLDLDQ